jgi:phosphoserine phosphatase RsbU/P
MGNAMAGNETFVFSKRLAELAARFEQSYAARARKMRSSGNGGALDAFINDLHDLFTRDVTREGLRDLVRRDARETYRFYTQTVDFESLRPLPWYQRYPAVTWKVFVALAHRLSPPRRIAFAIAVFLAVIGWIQLLVFRDEFTGYGPYGISWLLISFAILFMLLLVELRDKLDLKGDLEIAREIQFGLVPAGPFHAAGTSIYSSMRPANTVGGDYYDIIELDKDRLAVIMGDVSGKGIPAALLMALLQGSLRTLAAAGLRGSDLISSLNRYLCDSLPSNRLITLFYGEFDTAAGLLRYVNAGHNAPFLIRGGGQPYERLSSTSLVLGINPVEAYPAEEVRVCPGDRLLLFTDGITEAFNSADEEYGESRLASFLQSHADVSPPELVKAIVDDVLRFCTPVSPRDDMTLMLLERRDSHS